VCFIRVILERGFSNCLRKSRVECIRITAEIRGFKYRRL
jgi:hypothetical protein